MTTQGKGLSLEELQAVMDANGGRIPEGYWDKAAPSVSAVKQKPAKKLSMTEQRQALLDEADAGIAQAKDALQQLFDDLDEKRSNLEEHFSGTERYSRYEEACSAIETAIGELDGIEIGIELP